MAILRPLDPRSHRNIRPGKAHIALSERYVEMILPEDPSRRAISRSSPLHRLTTGPISVKRTIDRFIQILLRQARRVRSPIFQETIPSRMTCTLVAVRQSIRITHRPARLIEASSLMFDIEADAGVDAIFELVDPYTHQVGQPEVTTAV